MSAPNSRPSPTPSAEQYRRRRRATPELLRHVERSGEPRIPWRAMPGLAQMFVDDADVLRHLGGIWSQALAGQVDAVLDEEGSLEDCVERAAARLAAARPALHALLVAYAEHPVVRRAAARDAARAGAPGASAHAHQVAPRPAPRRRPTPASSTADRRPTSTPGPSGRCRLRGLLRRAGSTRTSA